MSSLKLQFVIDAVDRATGVLARVDRAVDRATAPVRRLQAQWQTFSRDPSVVNAMGRLVQTAQPIVAWGRTVATTLGVVATAGAGVVFALDRVVQRVSSVADQAIKLGMTTEQLTRLTYAAEQAGASPEALVTGLTLLSDKLTEARQGSKEAREMFRQVGVSAKDLDSGIGVPEALVKMVQTISAVADTAQNAATKIMVMKFFMGRGGPDLVQLFNSGAAGLAEMAKAADELGITLDSSAAAAMKEYGDKTQTLSAVLNGAWTRITAVALPSMKKVVDRLIEMAAAANNSDWPNRMGSALGRLVDVLPDVIEFLLDLVDAMMALGSWINRVVGWIGGWNTVLAVVVGLIAGSALAALYALTAAFAALALAVIANPLSLWIIAIGAGAAFIISAWEPVKSFFVSLWEPISRVLNALPKLGSIMGGPVAGAPSIYAGDKAWQDYRNTGAGAAVPGAVAGAAVPPAVGGRAGAPVEVGGQLRITLDTEGKVKGADLKKQAGSPMDIEVAYNGGTMPL